MFDDVLAYSSFLIVGVEARVVRSLREKVNLTLIFDVGLQIKFVIK